MYISLTDSDKQQNTYRHNKIRDCQSIPNQYKVLYIIVCILYFYHGACSNIAKLPPELFTSIINQIVKPRKKSSETKRSSALGTRF